MAHEIIMPKAGMSMEEGKVIRWLKKEGEAVDSGEAILEIETDKVSMEVEAMASGVLLRVLAEEGEIVPVTHVIGYIGEMGETIATEKKVQEIAKVSAATTTESDKKIVLDKKDNNKIAATPLARTLSIQKNIVLSSVVPTGKHGEIRARDINQKRSATPLAQKVALAEGIGLEGVLGSGKAGKIFKEDVLNAMPQMKQTEPTVSTTVGISGMRRVIAQRMVKSHQEVPPVTLDIRADVTDISAFRKKINDKHKLHITFNDLVVWAAAKSFKEMPEMNIRFMGNGIAANEGVHIGIAVAIENGLIVPVLRNTDQFSLKNVSQKAKELVEKAKKGTLQPDEYSGGTFTISNLGMYGIRYFTPIINQPESMILGVCAVEPFLDMDELGKIEKRYAMGLSLTFDHRCLDGAQAAAFLKKITDYLENPMEMLV